MNLKTAVYTIVTLFALLTAKPSFAQEELKFDIMNNLQNTKETIECCILYHITHEIKLRAPKSLGGRITTRRIPKEICCNSSRMIRFGQVYTFNKEDYNNFYNKCSLGPTQLEVNCWSSQENSFIRKGITFNTFPASSYRVGYSITDKQDFDKFILEYSKYNPNINPPGKQPSQLNIKLANNSPRDLSCTFKEDEYLFDVPTIETKLLAGQSKEINPFPVNYRVSCSQLNTQYKENFFSSSDGSWYQETQINFKEGLKEKRLEIRTVAFRRWDGVTATLFYLMPTPSPNNQNGQIPLTIINASEWDISCNAGGNTVFLNQKEAKQVGYISTGSHNLYCVPTDRKVAKKISPENKNFTITAEAIGTFFVINEARWVGYPPSLRGELAEVISSPPQRQDRSNWEQFK